MAPLKTRRLKVHERETRSDGIAAVGVLRDGCREHTWLFGKRFWRVRGAVQALAQRRQASKGQVEAVTEHALLQGLVRRETLSVFNTVYVFIRRSCDEPVELWPTVASELSVFAGLLLFFASTWDMPGMSTFWLSVSLKLDGVCAARCSHRGGEDPVKRPPLVR